MLHGLALAQSCLAISESPARGAVEHRIRPDRTSAFNTGKFGNAGRRSRNLERLQGHRGLQQGILSWGPVLLCMVVAFFLSSLSDPPVPKLGPPTLDFILRKLGHFTGYAILAAFLYRALRPRRRAFLLAFAIASLYAASDEWHQTYVPLREGTVRDWAIDSMGSVVALVGMAWRGRERT